MSEPTLPDFGALEVRVVEELRAAIAILVAEHADEPLAAIVLWADPYKGWYEVLFDTQARNEVGARARNAQWLARLPELAAAEDAWKTAATVARRTQALPFDPRHGEFSGAEDPIHTFDVSFDAFLRSPHYEALNVGGEDGWLEGHVRFVLARAIARLVEEGAFAGLPRAARLHLGYAYPDSSDATIVAIVEG